MDGHALDADLHRDFSAIAESVECELLHVRFANNQLQIFLDRPDGGVTIDHCRSVSKQVSALLDVHDFGKKRYVLEVSSPGLDRELFGPRDFVRFQGNLARVTFLNDEERRQTVIGRLQEFTPNGELPEDEPPGVDTQGILIVHQEEPNTVVHRIPTHAIQKARLEIEI